MKARKLMCYGSFCHPDKIKHDREKMVIDGQKHYCHKCWNHIKQQRRDRRLLYNYLRDNPSVRISAGVMIREINMLRKQYNYDFKGIKTALVYASKNQAKFSFSHKNFLRYVPYVYDQAQRWRYSKDKHDNMVLDHSHINNQVTHVKVDHNVFKTKKKPHYYDMSKF